MFLNLLNLITLILSYDIWFYISHLILHIKKIYFIHKVHHSIKYDNLKYFNAYTGHNFEKLFQGIGILFPYVYISFNIYSFIIASILINARGMMRHDNRFAWLIGNHHLLHHQYFNYNFGEYWLDYLFGTLYPNKDEYVKSIFI